jgi:hypothetical protein
VFFLASGKPYSRSEKAMINKSLTIGNEHSNLNGRSPSLAARASREAALKSGKPKQRHPARLKM